MADTLSLAIALPEEALAAARELGLQLDPRHAAELAGPLSNLIAAVSVHSAHAAVEAMLPSMLLHFLKGVVPHIAGALDQRTTKHVEGLVAAYLAAAPAPAPPGPLQVEIVGMPAQPKKKISYEYGSKGEVKTAEIVSK